mmetsp:Transcript_6904/g.22345  ORF Transcript_6904/g.22345 Transcript_6904/m.22345 type:complete len:313 (+) Transcript_6904:185-1123(+)
MLAAFPFRLEVGKLQVHNLRFAAKDLFAGSETEVAKSLQKQQYASQDPFSPNFSGHHKGFAHNHQGREGGGGGGGSGAPAPETPRGGGPFLPKKKLAEEEKDLGLIKVPKLILDGALVAPIHEGGYDLAELLRIFVNKLTAEVLRTAPLVSAVFHIMPLLAGHVVRGHQRTDPPAGSVDQQLALHRRTPRRRSSTTNDDDGDTHGSSTAWARSASALLMLGPSVYPFGSNATPKNNNRNNSTETNDDDIDDDDDTTRGSRRQTGSSVRGPSSSSRPRRRSRQQPEEDDGQRREDPREELPLFSERRTSYGRR